MEEDCNALVADCIVISCCCQCLILQILVFIFLHVPQRMARKTKEYAKRKLTKKRNAKLGERTLDKGDDDQCNEDHNRRSMRVLELEDIDGDKLIKLGQKDCMDEVEKALEELSMRGEFGFGSFWGGDVERRGSCSKCVVTNEGLQYGSHVVKFHLIQVVGPFPSSC